MKNFWKKYKYLLISCASVAAVLLVWYILIDVMKLTKNSVFPGVGKTFQTFVVKLTEKKPDGATLGQHLQGMPPWIQYRRSAGDSVRNCHGLE